MINEIHLICHILTNITELLHIMSLCENLHITRLGNGMINKMEQKILNNNLSLSHITSKS